MKQKKTVLNHEFSADMAPQYEQRKKKKYEKQGKISFIDSFYTLYRKWVKNE